MLEEVIRNASGYRSSLYVITGPTYEGQQRSMPKADEPHDVPDGYFKIVYNVKGEAAGFWMPQGAERKANYCDFNTALIEIQAKVDFTLPVTVGDSTATLKALGC